MARKWKEYDRHHIVGQCNRKRANIEHKDNKILIDIVRHRGLNLLFQNLQSPHEQLGYLREMYDGILSRIAKELLDELLELPRELFYKDDIIK